MAENSSMLAVISEIIAAQFGGDADEITRETTAMDVDGWDSASHVILVLEVEQQLGVTFPDERVSDLRDVGDMIDIVEGLIGGKGKD
jgi:acyl carrier protein